MPTGAEEGGGCPFKGMDISFLHTFYTQTMPTELN